MRDNRPPYFPFYPGDFASDGLVEAMTPQQVGAYILLLCKAWWETPPASIPNDDSMLARWARMTPDEWLGCRAGVLRPFTLRGDGRLYQGRLESEYARFRQLAGRRSEAGQRGAEARWNGNRMAIASQTHGKGMAKPMANDAIPYPEPELIPRPVFPPALDTPAFRAKWEEWLSYRRERRLQAWTKRTIASKFRQFEAWGVEAAIGAMELAISNGWMGVFPPHGATNGRGKQRGNQAADRRAAKAGREYDEGPMQLPIAQ